jgi:nucleotide-binding universal stress UspA family protein
MAERIGSARRRIDAAAWAGVGCAAMNAIVVGTDGSPGAEAAVQRVIEMARGSGATVHLVCAYPGRSTLERLGLTGKQDAVDMRGVAADVLARDQRRFEEAGFAIEKHAREGDPAQTLIDVAVENDADLIAVGAHGNTGLKRFALGAVSSKLTHHAPTSLLIVRED